MSGATEYDLFRIHAPAPPPSFYETVPGYPGRPSNCVKGSYVALEFAEQVTAWELEVLRRWGHKYAQEMTASEGSS